MKVSQVCYKCLQRLADQACTLATDDESTKDEAMTASLAVLDDMFSYDQVSIVIATQMHDTIKAITKNPDPYNPMKLAEIEAARDMIKEIRPSYDDGFESLLRLAALGNAIDFFRPIDEVRQEIRDGLVFEIDDSKIFEARLSDAQDILYLADNAGEIFFDVPLVQWLGQFARVAYVVKDAPVQNDCTKQEIKQAGLDAVFPEVLTTGTATPGIDFAQASEEFTQRFISADLVVAKGMGYYESLSELPGDGRIFYCLKAKCDPVADAIGVPHQSYIAMMY